MVLLAAICLWAGLFPAGMVYYAFQAAQAITGMQMPFVIKANILNPLLLASKFSYLAGPFLRSWLLCEEF